MTATLTPVQLRLVEESARLRALADCLTADADDPTLTRLADELRAISRRLWEAVDEAEGEQ